MLEVEFVFIKRRDLDLEATLMKLIMMDMRTPYNLDVDMAGSLLHIPLYHKNHDARPLDLLLIQTSRLCLDSLPLITIRDDIIASSANIRPPASYISGRKLPVWDLVGVEREPISKPMIGSKL